MQRVTAIWSGAGGSTHMNKAYKVMPVPLTPTINTGWGMKELRAALSRKTWGYWWMKSWT